MLEGLPDASRGETGIRVSINDIVRRWWSYFCPYRIVITMVQPPTLSTIQITMHMCYNYATSINQSKPLVSG
jgi:hypothetical protein